MKKINEKELKNIKGGFSVWAIFGIAAGIVFGIGVFDGIIRPLKCY
jgi:lactobin A/cerein 7B family class IIb bacteriocin